MAITFESIIAGAPPTGGDSGSEFARKINDNFAKLTTAADANATILAAATATLYGLSSPNNNVDAALNALNRVLNYGKVTALSISTDTPRDSYVAFNTINFNDYNNVDLVTYPTRITVPNGCTKAVAKFGFIAGAAVQITAYIRKNGSDIDTFSVGDTNGKKYMEVSREFSVVPGDYIQLYKGNAGGIPVWNDTFLQAMFY